MLWYVTDASVTISRRPQVAEKTDGVMNTDVYIHLSNFASVKPTITKEKPRHFGKQKEFLKCNHMQI